MKAKLLWLQDRPFLLWLGMWSVFFEVMSILPRTKSSNSMFSVLYFQPVLWTLLRCVRPMIAKYLRILYGILFLTAVPISKFSKWEGIVPIGIACFSALGIDLIMNFAKLSVTKQ